MDASPAPQQLRLPGWDPRDGHGSNNFPEATSTFTPGDSATCAPAPPSLVGPRVGNRAEAAEIAARVEAMFEEAWTTVPLLRALSPERRAELNAAWDLLLSSRDWSGAGALLMGVHAISLEHDALPAQRPGAGAGVVVGLDGAVLAEHFRFLRMLDHQLQNAVAVFESPSPSSSGSGGGGGGSAAAVTEQVMGSDGTAVPDGDSDGVGGTVVHGRGGVACNPVSAASGDHPGCGDSLSPSPLPSHMGLDRGGGRGGGDASTSGRFTHAGDHEAARERGGVLRETGACPGDTALSLSRAELDKVVGILQWIRGVLEGSRRTHRRVLDAMPPPATWSDTLPPSAKEIVGVHLYNDLSDAAFAATRVADAEGYTGARGVSWFRGNGDPATATNKSVSGGARFQKHQGGAAGGTSHHGGSSRGGIGGSWEGGGCGGGEDLDGDGRGGSGGSERHGRGSTSGSEYSSGVGGSYPAAALPQTVAAAWQLLDALEMAEAVWASKRADQEVLDHMAAVDLGDLVAGAAATLTFGLVGGGGGGGPGRRRAEDLTRRAANAAALRGALYARYPAVGLTSLEAAKVARNEDTALGVLEAYARCLTHTAAALRERARDMVYAHYAARGEACPLDGPGPRAPDLLGRVMRGARLAAEWVYDMSRAARLETEALVGVTASDVGSIACCGGVGNGGGGGGGDGGRRGGEGHVRG